MTITLTPQATTAVQLRIPGDLFRAVNPRNFSSPLVTAYRHDTDYGTVFAVTAKVEGIPETFDLLYTVDADWADVQTAVDEFNADPITSWADLLRAFFTEQRGLNAAKRALLDQDESFLLELEAGFLR